ncbi:MAG: hypothetical protein ABID87_05150 [Chloroflexota bacterium]
MRLRSTGLGKTELKARAAEITTKDGYLIMVMQTIEPVQWRVRAAMTPGDIGALVRLLLRPKVLMYLLSSLPRWFTKSSAESGKLTDF